MEEWWVHSLCRRQKPGHHWQPSVYQAFPSLYLDPLLPQEFTQPPREFCLRLSNLLELNSFIALFRLKALPLAPKFVSVFGDHKAPFKLPASTAGAQQKPLWYKVHWAWDVSVATLLTPLCMGIWRQMANAPKIGGARGEVGEPWARGNRHFGSCVSKVHAHEQGFVRGEPPARAPAPLPPHSLEETSPVCRWWQEQCPNAYPYSKGN